MSISRAFYDMSDANLELELSSNSIILSLFSLLRLILGGRVCCVMLLRTYSNEWSGPHSCTSTAAMRNSIRNSEPVQ
jgi:hypothetical protein